MSKNSRIKAGDLVRVKPTWSFDYLRQSHSDLDGKVGVVTQIIPALTPYGTSESDPMCDTYVILIEGKNNIFHGIRFLEKVRSAKVS